MMAINNGGNTHQRFIFYTHLILSDLSENSGFFRHSYRTHPSMK